MAQARREAASTTAPTAAPRTTHRVLVVDDSLNTREIEKDVLEAWGYHVTLAENGRDGLTKALAEPFDAVLTDVEMPVMDGFALTAQLRENDDYRHRPIIIITSREKEADRRRGIEVGADAYIVKGSFDQNNLVETLQALLG
jgi:two-component system chemotaxis sensor kinase CheA